VLGFGGMRDMGEFLEFAPRLPDGLTHLAFSVNRRGLCLRVDVTSREARYSVRGTGALSIAHHGERLKVTVGDPPVVRPIPPATERPEPTQPPGRAPRRRSRE